MRNWLRGAWAARDKAGPQWIRFAVSGAGVGAVGACVALRGGLRRTKVNLIVRFCHSSVRSRGAWLPSRDRSRSGVGSALAILPCMVSGGRTTRWRFRGSVLQRREQVVQSRRICVLAVVWLFGIVHNHRQSSIVGSPGTRTKGALALMVLGHWWREILGNLRGLRLWKC